MAEPDTKFTNPEQAINYLRRELDPDSMSDEYLTAAWAYVDAWMTSGGVRPQTWSQFEVASPFSTPTPIPQDKT